MANIALFNIPFSGHVNPTLQLTSQLVERGHSVDYWVTNNLAGKIKPTGARLRTYPDSVHFPTGAENLFALTTQLATAANQLYPWLLRELQQHPPDIILTDSSTVWGQYLGLQLDIPVVTLFPNVVVTPRVLTNSPKTILKTCFDAGRHLGDTVTAIKQSYQFTDQHHPYQTGQPMDILGSSSDTNIVFTSQQFQPGGKSFNDSFHFVGPQISLAAPKKKATTKPSLYISLGTLYNNNRRFYHNCIRALARTGYQITISTGSTEMTQFLRGAAKEQVEDAGTNPKAHSRFIIEDRVDQLKVLSECDLFITHGGMNSVSEAIAAKVPMLVVPQTIEQSINGARVAQLGLGEYQHNLFAHPGKLRQVVSKMISNKANYQQSLTTVADSFKNAHRSTSAVTIIEKRLDKSKRQPKPTILLIHGYGTNIESSFTRPRGKSGGFYAFSPLLISQQAQLFRWDVPFRPKFPDTVNPLALLTMYQQEKMELKNKALFKRLHQTITENKTTTIITHSLGSELLITYLRDYRLPSSVKRIITIQSDMPKHFELHDSVTKRLQDETLTWENVWCWWDQALMVSGIMNRSGRAGLLGTRVSGIKNRFYPLIRNGNLHISSIIDPEFVKRLELE